MVGFDEGEGINYLSRSEQNGGGAVLGRQSYGEKEWDNAIINLINANYKTDEARNYIQKFLRFEYKNWTLPNPNPNTYRTYILQVSSSASTLCDCIFSFILILAGVRVSSS